MRYATGVFTFLLAPLALAAASDNGGNALAQLALDKIIRDGRDVFGDLNNNNNNNNNSHEPTASSSRHERWMAAVPDTVPLTHLNIPGTHDAATWNYTQATQDSLADATRCDGTTPGIARVYRCQRLSMASALERGIRFFDLRFALDPANARLVFWHGPALLSAAAAVEDVLFALYAWLDAHPSETVLASLQYERGTRPNATSDAVVQGLLLDALTSPAATRYVLQTRGALGTLGGARGKVVLLRRFDLDALPKEHEDAMPGLHLAPAKWVDNGKSFELAYNATSGARAFIEDFYHPDDEVTVAANIGAKFEAVRTHLETAAAGRFESLFVTFASATHVEVEPPVYPEVMALGSSDVEGVNHRLRELLGGMRGKRLGVLVMDFFEEPDGLVDLLLDF